MAKSWSEDEIGSGEANQTRVAEWLTSGEVKERCGFDPGEPAGSPYRNKLVPRGDGFVRVWLKEDLEKGLK